MASVNNALAAIGGSDHHPPGVAAARPDAFRPGLATSLNNLAVLLAAMGRAEEALDAIQEAADIRRELAARWPDVYHHELEQSLQIAAWLENREDLKRRIFAET